MLQDCEIGFFSVRIVVVGLFAAWGTVERWIHVVRCAREDKGVEIFDLGGEIAQRQLERHVNRFAFGGCRRTVCHSPTAHRLVCRT